MLAIYRRAPSCGCSRTHVFAFRPTSVTFHCENSNFPLKQVEKPPWRYTAACHLAAALPSTSVSRETNSYGRQLDTGNPLCAYACNCTSKHVVDARSTSVTLEKFEFPVKSDSPPPRTRSHGCIHKHVFIIRSPDSQRRSLLKI